MTFIKPCQLYRDAFSSAAVGTCGGHLSRLSSAEERLNFRGGLCVCEKKKKSCPRPAPTPASRVLSQWKLLAPEWEAGWALLKKKPKKKKKCSVLPLSSWHYWKHTHCSGSTLTALHSLGSVFDCYGVDIWSHLLTMAAKNTRGLQHVWEWERALGPNDCPELVWSSQDSP